MVKKDFTNKHPNHNQSYNKSSKTFKKRVTNQDILTTNAFKSTRDAEWFKKTITTIEKIKNDLDNKFFNEEKRAQKIDFIRILKTKIKDYKDAQKNAELYKSIRFFERRKLERQLKQLNKKIDSNTNEN